MRRSLRIGLISLGVMGLLLGAGIAARGWLIVRLLALGGPPDLLPAGDEGPGVRWFDDDYTVEPIDPRTFAIGEPRYAHRNYNYLVVGRDRAVLFDAGSGHRDIRPVARSLTDKPILFVPSHFHYDHVGNGIAFDDVGVVDLPELRARAGETSVGAGGRPRLELTWEEHLGAAEGFGNFAFEVAVWLEPGSEIDLGGRKLEVLYTPGHTPESISLLDREARLLFSGDFLYPAELYAFVPNSDLADYQQGARLVIDRVPPDVRILGAHRLARPFPQELALSDVIDLRDSLARIREGNANSEGIYPVRYEVNERLDLLAEPAFLQSWSASHPELASEQGD